MSVQSKCVTIQNLPAALKESLGADLSGRLVAIWCADIAPAAMKELVALIEKVIGTAAHVHLHCSEGLRDLCQIFDGKVEYCATPEAALVEADALILAAGWSQRLEEVSLASLMRRPLVFECQMSLEASEAAAGSFENLTA